MILLICPYYTPLLFYCYKKYIKHFRERTCLLSFIPRVALTGNPGLVYVSLSENYPLQGIIVLPKNLSLIIART